MKHLLAVGCSFTAGDGLPKSIDEAPFLVAKKLGLYSTDKADGKKPEYVNMSQPGGCNSFIRRKTINWLCENKDMWKDIIVLVGWTNPLRDEVFVSGWYPENNDDRLSRLNNSNGYLQLGTKSPPQDDMPTFLKKDRLIDNNFYKEYMVRHYSFENQISTTIDNIFTLQNFLKLNDIKYVFWNSLDFSEHDYSDLYKWNNADLMNDLKVIDEKRKYLRHQKWVIGMDNSWEEFLNDLDPPYGLKYRLEGDSHPNELGHKLWADEIYKKIEELYGKEL
jgi:hypothetical protein